jgi:flavin reductase (NADH)
MPVEPSSFREALAHWASGITAVTVPDGSGYWGMTASAFASVSLDPPLIMVAIANSARTLALIQKYHQFGVNLLAADQESASRIFSSSDPKLPAELNSLVLPGALAHLQCQVWQIYPGGDHQIVVGAVQEARVLSDSTPLIYWHRNYRALKTD